MTGWGGVGRTEQVGLTYTPRPVQNRSRVDSLSHLSGKDRLAWWDVTADRLTNGRTGTLSALQGGRRGSNEVVSVKTPSGQRSGRHV